MWEKNERIRLIGLPGFADCISNPGYAACFYKKKSIAEISLTDGCSPQQEREVSWDKSKRGTNSYNFIIPFRVPLTSNLKLFYSKTD